MALSRCNGSIRIIFYVFNEINIVGIDVTCDVTIIIVLFITYKFYIWSRDKYKSKKFQCISFLSKLKL